jgi:hypothetical protein
MATSAAIHATGNLLSLAAATCCFIAFHFNTTLVEACVDGRLRGHDEKWG